MNWEQMKKYRGIWARVKKVFVELGEFSDKEAEEERMAIHTRVLGSPKSSKDFNDKDLDKVLKAFKAILVIVDGPTAPGEISGACKRLIWAIEKLAVPEPYLEKICTDQFGTAAWRTLPEEKLSKFRMTATARAGALKKKQKP